MSPIEVLNMRKKQFIGINVSFIIVGVMYIASLSTIGINLKWLLFFLGIFIVGEGLFKLIKKDRTKSWIPFVEKIRQYEEEKMGEEWKKQEKFGVVSDFLFGFLLIWQSTWIMDSTVTQSNPIFLVTFFMIFIVIINVVTFLHARKIDHSYSPKDFNGYTYKSGLAGSVIGLVLGVFLTLGIIFYVITFY